MSVISVSPLDGTDSWSDESLDFVVEETAGDASSDGLSESINDGYQLSSLKGAHDFRTFLEQLRTAVNQNGELEHQVIQEFRAVVQLDEKLHANMERMIDEAYIAAEHSPDGLVASHIIAAPAKVWPPVARNLDEFFALMNSVITTSPKPARNGINDGNSLRTFPIWAILRFTHNTKAGDIVYRDTTFNHQLGKVLNTWNEYLDSPGSVYTVNDKDGWLQAPDIDWSLFVHDKSKPHWGFKSFNDFFTRELTPGVRPTAPGDNVAVSVAESHITRFGHNLKADALFCLKGEHYSLADMLAAHKHLVEPLIGGSLIQAFLRPIDYHRWHAPVAGMVVVADVVPGFYYNDNCPILHDFKNSSQRHSSQSEYETYLTNVAARGILAIETEQFGLVVVIPIGMAEVSTIKMSVKAGDHVEKGQELGLFQFGGSTTVTIFQQGVVTDFTRADGTKSKAGDQLKIGSHIAILTEIS